MLILLSTGRGNAQKGWPHGGLSDVERIEASPLLVDLDGNGRTEIIYPNHDDFLYVYNHDGTTFSVTVTTPPNWPQPMGYLDGTIASPAVGDIEGTGTKDIVVVGDDKSGKAAKVRVFRSNGTQLGTGIDLATTASGKATACIIDCYKYNGTTRHSAEEILVRDGNGRVHVIYWNGTALQELTAFDTTTSDTERDRFGSQPITPSVSAVDEGGGVTYIVAPSTNNKIYRWRVTSSSSSTTSFNFQVSPLASLQTDHGSTTQFLGSAALVNIDADPSYEIVIGASSKQVYVWDDDGTTYTGWPKQTSQTLTSSPAIADLDVDGIPEVIVGCDDGRVYAWHRDGSNVSGYPVETGGPIYSSPVCADIDGIEGLEVVATSLDGFMHAWSNSGQRLYGWPKQFNTNVYASPALGDIHRNGRFSVVTGGFDGRIFVFDLARKSLDVNAGWLQFRGGFKRQGHL